MVSHHKLPSGSNQVVSRYTDPMTGKRKKVTVTYNGDTRKAQRNAERELEDKIDALIEELDFKVETTIKTFSELTEEWLEFWSHGVDPQTVRRETLVLKRVKEIIKDDILIDRITPFFIEKVLNDYLRKYDSSYSTMIHIKSTLNRIFRYAVKHRLLVNTPMAVVELVVPREKKREIKKKRENKYLEPYELKAFLAETKKGKNRIYYYLTLFLVHSGLRIGEAGAITREDINFEKGTVSVNKTLKYETGIGFYYGPAKTEESERTILLPTIALESLKTAIAISDRIDRRNKIDPWKSYVQTDSVFRTFLGTPITSQAYRGFIARVEEKLKNECEDRYGFKWIKHVTPHSFRFINITYLKDSEGVDIKSVQSHVGHSDIRTTLGVYAQRSQKGAENLVAAMEKWSSETTIFDIESPEYYSRYSTSLDVFLQKNCDQKSIYLSIDDFRSIINLDEKHKPKYINISVLPTIKKNLSEIHKSFQIETVYGKYGKIMGYQIDWE